MASVNGMKVYRVGDRVEVSLGDDNRRFDHVGRIISGPHKEIGIAGPFHKVDVRGLGVLPVTNRFIRAAPRYVSKKAKAKREAPG